MDTHYSFVFDFQKFIQLESVEDGFPYFPSVIQVLFDEAYYLSNNPDVANALTNGLIASAAEHFLTSGFLEQRAPSQYFDEDLYLIANPDVQAAINQGQFTSGLQHFTQFGFSEGRDALALTKEINGIRLSSFFDEGFYRHSYQDIVDAVFNGGFSYGFEHFIRFGIAEGRNPSHYYNEDFYLAAHGDVAQAVETGAYSSGLEHYLKHGHFENRVASAFFDPELYLNSHADIAQAYEAGNLTSVFKHFLDFGQDEGRLSTLLFDEFLYLQENPDIQDAVSKGIFPNGYAHFLQFGIYEDRTFSKVFEETDYLAANPDVEAAIAIGSLKSGIEHYLKFGLMENRPLKVPEEPPEPLNTAPTASDDSAITQENTAVTVDVLNNDTDPDGDRLTITDIGTPNNGMVEPSTDGRRIIYTPNPGFSGSDSFTYTIADDASQTAIATVTVNIASADNLVDYTDATAAVLINLSEKNTSELPFGANFNLMPLGDSITRGVDGLDPDAEEAGYRDDLYAKLQTLGVAADFVGSLSSGSSELPDQDHEGHSGARFRFFTRSIEGFDTRIDSFIDSARPDIILLMLGTNNAGDSDETADDIDAQHVLNNMLRRMDSLLDIILGNSTFQGQVFVGTLAPADPNGRYAGRADRIRLFNEGSEELGVAGLEAIVTDKNSDRLHFVEVGSLLDPARHLADPSVDNGLHPNQDGYEIMAHAWYDALKSKLVTQTTSMSTETVNVIGSAFDDVLIGDTRSNILNGGNGADVLIGNGGSDQFVMNLADSGVDRIRDFDTDDRITVVATDFADELSAGFQVVSGSSPTPSNGQFTFIYDTSSGALSYDPDGVGATSSKVFAQLEGAPTFNENQLAVLT